MIILDLFLGSGTTLVACLQTDRVGLGVEINRNYCELATRRLKEEGLYQRKLEETLQSASETRV
jgi:site-specific DNA-methyltransferase (adenine-specific)